jgi:pyruvate-ferredoxin/flavodoxin oxidoreductase
LNPEKPVLRGTSQNPDVYFQGRETVNKYYTVCPDITQKAMDKFASLTGRQYHLFDYVGAKDAEKVIIMIGSGAEVAQETVEQLNSKGEKLGVLKVRLYRPFDVKAFMAALPSTVKSIAVLDRTKEPGSLGEPLYEDVRTAIGEAMEGGFAPFKQCPRVFGGRYGLGSAEFTPAMAKGVFDNLSAKSPKNHFTVGIKDDVANTSLDFDPSFSTETPDIYRAMFYGLGSDGTVGANKNSIKIIGDLTDNYSQGYFVYDSKKAGAVTVSHLRFGKKPIMKPYLISSANFLACHNFSFLEKYDMLKNLMDGGIFLLTSAYGKDTIWEHLPSKVQKQIVDKKIKFYVIDAIKIAEEVGLGGRINAIMQTAFFSISKVIDDKIAIDAIKKAIKKTYGSKGDKIVEMNVKAVDLTIAEIEEVKVPASFTGKVTENAVVSDEAPDFVKTTTAKIMKGEGETVTVSEMPDDGTWPTGTTQYEKRNIAVHIPVWNPQTCVQCGKCTMVCPHAVIRAKMYPEKYTKDAPKTFKYTAVKPKAKEGYVYTLQVAPEDCTGCGVCVENCPMKAKEAIKMAAQLPLRETERANFEYFLSLPETDPSMFNKGVMNGIQFVKPLFEFSGACAGCGETPYVKLLTQLFGDRALIANATGCSSIYGGNLPTTPYTKRVDGRGPAWSNSLFEDNAEVAFGMRLTVDKSSEYAKELADRIIASKACSSEIAKLLEEVKSADQSLQSGIEEQRLRVAKLKEALGKCNCPDCAELVSVADYFIKKSVWAVGGDGWAYDIGYGGLDHVIASGRNVNILVLDTEVYSNTGGQASKSTPMGAVARFAASGKPIGKKDLGMMAMSYGYVYVAKIAMGADPMQTIKAFSEAEAYDGPSLIIAYSHCIAQGINMTKGMDEHKKAVASGHWPLFRYNPELCLQGKNPLILDSKAPSIKLEDYIYGENRYNVLRKSDPARAKELLDKAQDQVTRQYKLYKYLADQKDACEKAPKNEAEKVQQ